MKDLFDVITDSSLKDRSTWLKHICKRALEFTSNNLKKCIVFDGLVVKVLDSQSRVLCSKPLGGSTVNSAFHPFKVDKMSTRNSWELNGKKQTASSKWL